jgi:hypothetical protein
VIVAFKTAPDELDEMEDGITTMMTKHELKEHLFDAYDGFADKRYKKIEHDAPFIVDDRGKGDLDARGHLFLSFCQMFATVEDGERVRISLHGGTPQSANVTQWYVEHGADKQKSGVNFDITPENVDDLLDLAKRFSDIIKRRYDTPAYKYVVPRVSASLIKLHDVLSSAWR